MKSNSHDRCEPRFVRRTWLALCALAVCIPAYAGFEEDLEALHKARDLAGIERVLAEANDDQLASAAGYRWRAWLADAQGEGDRARSLIDEGLEEWPENVELILSDVIHALADLSGKSGFSALRAARAAKGEMERAIELESQHARARLTLIRYQLNAPGIAGGGVGKARKQIEALERIDAGAHHAMKALLAASDERFDEASAHFEKARAEGASIGLMIDYAVSLQRQEAWDASWEILQSLAEQNPEYANAWYQLGRHAAESGQRLDAGLAALERFMDAPRWPEDPPPAAALWRIGMIHDHAGRSDRARAAWEDSLELDPEFAPARESLEAM